MTARSAKIQEEMALPQQLQVVLNAIAKHRSLLDALKTHIEKEKKKLNIQAGENDANKLQAADIYQKAESVYRIFEADFTRCEEKDIRDLKIIEEHCRMLEQTMSLLTAKVGDERSRALGTYLTTANEHYGDPAQRKRDLQKSLAILALGVAVVGIAVAIAVCLALHLWPFVPVLVPHWTWHVIYPSTVEYVLEIPVAVQCWGIVSSTFTGIIGLVISSFACVKGLYGVERYKYQPHEEEVRALHAAFFKPNKEIVDCCLVSENKPDSSEGATL